MKILITGAAGFLGLHLSHQFDKPTNQLRLLDIAEFDPKEYKSNRFQFLKVDIRDKKSINAALSGVDYVIHAAAALPLWPKEDIMNVNVNGTENLLQAALKNKIKHFVYISSTAVYGVPKKHPIYETDPMVGVGPYGESKIQAEKLCVKYRKKGLIVTIIRPKTFIGTHRLGVFEILFDWIKDGKKIPVLGNGQNRYQLLNVDDLADAVERVLLTKQKSKVNDVFNIAAEKFETVEKDLSAVFSYAKSGSKILKTPAGLIKKTLYVLEKLHLSPLYQWVYETADKDSFVSIEKLKKALKWSPKYSNADSLIQSYKWYEKNYKNIKKQGSGVTHTVGWKQGILGLFKKFL
ncbi:MAG TPA: NAD(P)-dependent oxidoreductase [Candidatus Nitrosocosmicus sp.]|nr:NAD(P)-dependent oxidoreductase [Candidatus Nitrosocosmicus sp.]